MPGLRRVTKQTTYAVIFAVIAASFLGFLIVPRIASFIRNRERPAEVSREAVVVERVDTVIRPGRVDIVARVRNPNPRAGVPEYPITFVLLNAEEKELARIEKNTFLLPGSLNYIAVIDVPLERGFARVRVEASEAPKLANLPAGVSAAPTFNSFLQGRNIRSIGNFRVEEQKGIVTNTGTLGYRHVDITGVAFDRNENVTGVGTTFVGELQVGEQREFTLQWPAPATATERVIVLPTANVYQADNLFSPQGNPAFLRGGVPVN